MEPDSSLASYKRDRGTGPFVPAGALNVPAGRRLPAGIGVYEW
jgi:hypothetical protein